MISVSLYTPSYPPDIGGNATSTHRLVNGLRANGVDVAVHRAPNQPPKDETFWEGRIVHAFHAYRTGAPLLPALRTRRSPLVVSMAGTDLNHDLLEPEHAVVVKEVCALADALVLMHEAQEELVLRSVPELKEKLVTIHPGVELPDLNEALYRKARSRRAAWGVKDDEIVLLLPAGLRQVKRPLFAIEPLARLRKEGIPVVLILLGSVIDDGVAAAFDHAVEGRAWIKRLPALTPDEMNACYLAADVVLNTSTSEGLSNAVIEAMAAGRPVLASDIEGNRACISNFRNGLLFGDEEAFLAKARRLAKEPSLRRALGETARADVADRFDPRREVERHIELYKSLRPCDGRIQVPGVRAHEGGNEVNEEIRLTELTSCGG